MDADEYYRSATAAHDAEMARSHWRMVLVTTGNEITHVVAEAGTGSRYEVVVTTMPDDSEDGIGTLIAVLAPWRAVTVTVPVDVHLAFVMEKLCDLRRNVQHMGDITALTMTINHAVRVHYGIQCEDSGCRGCSGEGEE